MPHDVMCARRRRVRPGDGSGHLSELGDDVVAAPGGEPSLHLEDAVVGKAGGEFGETTAVAGMVVAGIGVPHGFARDQVVQRHGVVLIDGQWSGQSPRRGAVQPADGLTQFRECQRDTVLGVIGT